MDLRPINAQATPEEARAIDAVLGARASGGDAPAGLKDARGKRHLLLPALHAAQSARGWVSPGALGYICERLHVPPAEGYGVASFYSLFALSERPRSVVHVCDDVACAARGAERVCEDLALRWGPAGRERDGATWLRSPCLGLCEQAPAAMLTRAGEPGLERGFGGASAERVVAALRTGRVEEPPRTVLPQPREQLTLLRRVGVVDPTSLDDYRAHGGYAALRRALEMGPAGVLREVTESGLAGRGGAAFPTGRKWTAVAQQPVRPHYLVCNADESEPGTFKDRVLMEDDPFAVLEAITIAAYATGCERAFVYVRGEYPLAIERLSGAIAQATARGLLGADIMGRAGVSLSVEIVKGAGAYICGEETALFNSLEGFRGEPRSKPPFPVEVGLFGKPTVVNNVETLVCVPEILRVGAGAFAAQGTKGSPGTKLFCVSGHVERPGLYEVPFGTRLDALIALAGGVANGKRVRAVLLGGAAGVVVTGDELAMPLSLEDARKAGATLGSGVVVVFDEDTDVLAMLRRIAAFFRDESCGQCVPCRVGTVRQEELLARVATGRMLGGAGEERVRLKELGQVMRDASICGLGQTASSAIESAIAKLGLLEGNGGARG